MTETWMWLERLRSAWARHRHAELCQKPCPGGHCRLRHGHRTDHEAYR